MHFNGTISKYALNVNIIILYKRQHKFNIYNKVKFIKYNYSNNSLF